MNLTLAEMIETYLGNTVNDWRRLTSGQWGITVDAAGWPLHVGIALRDGLLRIQAQVAASGQIPAETLLWWNRKLVLVKFSTTQDGEPWLQLDLTPSVVDERQLDRMLGLFVLTATQARETIKSPV
jgi:hypothetical protein